MTYESLAPRCSLRSVDDRTHALGGAGVLVQEFFYAGEIDGFLNLPVLEIVIADVAQLAVIGADEIPLR